MNERERKMLAFLTECLFNVAIGFELDGNKIQQLENIASELGAADLDDREFRW